MGQFYKVATVQELPPGQAKSVEAAGKQIALFNIAGAFYAIDDLCTHAGASLAEGRVESGEVECPWHGARFDLKTGAAKSAPASEGVSSYSVRVNGSDIEIEV